MVLDEPLIEELLNPLAVKALATTGPHGLNVVPVSSIRVVDEYIWLIDYFMNKTRENIQESSEVALVYWHGLYGHQIKADVEYFTQGPDFDEAVKWIAQEHPSRTVHGLLKLKPTAIHDISIANKV